MAPSENEFDTPELGNLSVFLSVVGICQLAADHTFTNPHLHINDFPPNQSAPSQSRIQNTHNPRFLIARLRHVTDVGQLDVAKKKA